MSSHHFLGAGLLSDSLRREARDPDRLLCTVAELVAESGLHVVADQQARFDNDGLTLVWILAESHLVMHFWGGEGFASLDLHVCDYKRSNQQKAQTLVDALTALCFAPDSQSWREVHLDDIDTSAAASDSKHSE